MSNQIKTALLAYGMSGKIFHAPFVKAHEGFELYAVLERHSKTAATDYPGVKSFDTMEQLLADPAIELVIVNTPNNLHFEQTKAVLEAGKHALVEKPVTSRPEELEALFALADQVGRQVLFYQNRRWDSDYQSVLAMVAGQHLGHIHEAHFRFDRYNLTLSPKKFKEMPIDASGIQYDLIPHVLDQAIALFGVPDRYYKRLLNLRPESQVNDFCSIQLSYPGNLEVYVAASLVTARQPPAFRLYGDKGSFEKMRSDVQEDQLKAGVKPVDPGYGHPPEALAGLYTKAGDEVQPAISIAENDSNYLGLFEAVNQTIRNGAAYPVKREQVLAQIRILAAAAN